MISINDQLHTFDDAQLQRLNDRAKAYPFDVKLTVSDGGRGKAELQADAAARITGPKQIAIVVDPKHRFTYVRGSKDLGLPNGPELASAGNAFFKKGDLVGGVDAIMGRADQLKVQSRVVTGQGAPIIVHEHTTSAGVWWMLGGVAAVVLAVLCYWAWRAKKRDDELKAKAAELNNEIGDRRLERAERDAGDDFDRRLRRLSVPAATPTERTVYPDPPAPRAVYSAPPARTVASQPPYYSAPPVYPSPAPVAVQPQRDLLTDMLLIDAIEDRHHYDRVIERERVVERAPDSGSSSAWSDSGSSDSSSSSSWDSGSDSSSSDSSLSDSSGDWGGGGGGDSW